MRFWELISQAILSFFVVASQIIFGNVNQSYLAIVDPQGSNFENQASASANPVTEFNKFEEIAIPVIESPIPSTSPISTPELKSIGGPDQYVMEDHPSGEEGFYVLKNAPSEPMSTVEELNQAVQNYRQAHGLNQVYIDPQLCEIAYQRAVEAKEVFSHDKFSEHVKAGDYDYVGFNTISENLWQGSFSGVHIVEFGWDRSPGHRANLQGPWNRGCGGIYQTTATFVFAN